MSYKIKIFGNVKFQGKVKSYDLSVPLPPSATPSATPIQAIATPKESMYIAM